MTGQPGQAPEGPGWVPEEPGWVPEGIDTGKANGARVYDYVLGGSHNFRADQDAARALIAVEPNTRAIGRENRAFLGRAVRFLAGQAGIRQFLDIGSGIPTEQNVHQVAHQFAPGSRVVYVDHDEVAVAHSRLILADDTDAAIVQADLREPAKILADPATQLLIDLSQPVAVLLVAVLHFIPDADNPAQILATLRDALAPGSYLVISHACRDAKPVVVSAIETVYRSRVAGQITARTREQIAAFFAGFEVVEPGLAWLPEWRPDSPADVPGNPAQYWVLAGAARRAPRPLRQGVCCVIPTTVLYFEQHVRMGITCGRGDVAGAVRHYRDGHLPDRAGQLGLRRQRRRVAVRLGPAG
jgi:SAM-dependent methyltransferase